MRIEIDIPAQTLTLFDDGKEVRRYVVSTAKNGPGEKNGSFCTPRGRHVVRAKIGAGQAENTVFVRRRPTGERWSPELHARYPGDVDTMRRYIYIHGSPPTSEMGKPGSIGCVRMHNPDIVELFELVPVGTPVLIRG